MQGFSFIVVKCSCCLLIFFHVFQHLDEEILTVVANFFPRVDAPLVTFPIESENSVHPLFATSQVKGGSCHVASGEFHLDILGGEGSAETISPTNLIIVETLLVKRFLRIDGTYLLERLVPVLSAVHGIEVNIVLQSVFAGREGAADIGINLFDLCGYSLFCPLIIGSNTLRTVCL